jgi:hypothetical protein
MDACRRDLDVLRWPPARLRADTVPQDLATALDFVHLLKQLRVTRACVFLSNETPNRDQIPKFFAGFIGTPNGHGL